MARLFLACIQDSITWKGDWLQIIHIVDNIRRQIQVLATILQQFFSPSNQVAKTWTIFRKILPAIAHEAVSARKVSYKPIFNF